MKLGVAVSRDKNTKWLLMSYEPRFDMWSLDQDLSAVIRTNKFNGLSGELSWQEILFENPWTEEGYNLFINDILTVDKEKASKTAREHDIFGRVLSTLIELEEVYYLDDLTRRALRL